MPTVREYDVVVIGAGFSGLCMLHRFLADGLTVRVFESAPDVGGAWYWNRYPGARCDVESRDYSFSFDDDLQQEWHWTERYAAQPEILAYLRHVTDRFGLRPHISFDTTVSAVHLDANRSMWTVRTTGGEEVIARYCVMATGCLSVPKEPEIPGLADFRGPVYRTARWPESEVDFTGTRVGVVGTGSSGVQVIPAIAGQASHLTVFQRTPAFVAPARNRPVTAEADREMKAGYAERRRQNRLSRSGMAREISTQSALEADEELLASVYGRRWEMGGFAILGAFADLLVDRRANDTAAAFIRSKIREVVRDPDVAARLMPWDYPVGARRLCVGTDYYETYNHDNVTLVDLRETPLESVTATGVRTSRHHHDLDCLVLATGFDAITGALTRIDIQGRNGAVLAEKWRDGPRTYLGLCTAGFPNLFILVGPGSPSVLTNMVTSIEQQVEWISACVKRLEHRTIEPTPEAENQWMDHVGQIAGATLFSKAASWYSGANVPGKPQVFMPYAGGLDTYERICEEVAEQGYRGFVLGYWRQLAVPGALKVQTTPRVAAATLEPDPDSTGGHAIRLGLANARGLHDTAEQVVAERTTNSPYRDMTDLGRRLSLTQPQLEDLATPERSTPSTSTADKRSGPPAPPPATAPTTSPAPPPPATPPHSPG